MFKSFSIWLTISSVTKAITDSNVELGRASMGIELVDFVSSDRLVPTVEWREGSKQVGSGKWDDAEEPFDHWAEKLGNYLASKECVAFL